MFFIGGDIGGSFVRGLETGRRANWDDIRQRNAADAERMANATSWFDLERRQAMQPGALAWDRAGSDEMVRGAPALAKSQMADWISAYRDRAGQFAANEELRAYGSRMLPLIEAGQANDYWSGASRARLDGLLGLAQTYKGLGLAMPDWFAGEIEAELARLGGAYAPAAQVQAQASLPNTETLMRKAFEDGAAGRSTSSSATTPADDPIGRTLNDWGLKQPLDRTLGQAIGDLIRSQAPVAPAASGDQASPARSMDAMMREIQTANSQPTRLAGAPEPDNPSRQAMGAIIQGEHGRIAKTVEIFTRPDFLKRLSPSTDRATLAKGVFEAAGLRRPPSDRQAGQLWAVLTAARDTVPRRLAELLRVSILAEQVSVGRKEK